MKTTKKYKNPALKQELIGHPASIIAPRDSESIFNWIQSTGRFKSNEPDLYHDDKPTNEIEELIDEEELDQD